MYQILRITYRVSQKKGESSILLISWSNFAQIGLPRIFLKSSLYWLLKIVQDWSNLIKIDQNIAKANIVKDFENILFCKTSKNQKIKKMSQVGELTLCLFIFFVPQIYFCSAHNKPYIENDVWEVPRIWLL